MRSILVLAILFTSLFTVGCDDVAGLARLDHAQILAVRTEPANVAPGQRARVDLLAGDDSGEVFEASPETLTAGVLAVEHAADGWYVTAGATPEIATLEVSLTIDGTVWRAAKSLVVNVSAANPTIATMQVDGAASEQLVVPVGSKPALAASGEGRDPLEYAWYSSVGDLEGYRQPTAMLDAAAPAEGTVVVVVRDSAGGVSWQLVPARVE